VNLGVSLPQPNVSVDASGIRIESPSDPVATTLTSHVSAAHEDV
jgi:hypothetical protein